MNDFISEITLDLNCKETPVVISAGQYDVNRKIIINVTANGNNYSVAGCIAVCKGIGGDGKNHFAINCTVDDENNKIILNTDETMFLTHGNTVARIVISDGRRIYSTQKFIVLVGSAFDGDITQAESYSILNDLISRVIQVTETGGIIVDEAFDSNSKNPLSNSFLTPLIENIQNNKVSTKEEISSNTSSYPSIEYLQNYYYDFDETYSADEIDTALASKADKATTLEGYGITDAYTKEQMSKYLNNKQDKLGWDTVPAQNSPNAMTSGSIYTALQSKANTADVNSKLALKYDASNVETGSGALECADETLTDKLAATFKYQKIGKFCMLDIQIKATEKIDGDVMFDGLPFVAKSASYSVCSSNYGNVRSLIIPYNNSKLKLIGGITTTTTVAITVIYCIEN